MIKITILKSNRCIPWNILQAIHFFNDNLTYDKIVTIVTVLENFIIDIIINNQCLSIINIIFWKTFISFKLDFVSLSVTLFLYPIIISRDYGSNPFKSTTHRGLQHALECRLPCWHRIIAVCRLCGVCRQLAPGLVATFPDCDPDHPQVCPCLRLLQVQKWMKVKRWMMLRRVESTRLWVVAETEVEAATETETATDWEFEVEKQLLLECTFCTIQS